MGVRGSLVVASLALAGLLISLIVAGCNSSPKGTFTILSGSENRTLEPIVLSFCEENRWQCQFRYAGSVDIKLALEDPALNVDAVWPAHGRWIEMGDRQRRVKHARSIMTSPVAFGIRDDVASALGLKGRKVTTAEFVDLVRKGNLSYLMTSATQSNSGFSAYIGMLSALAGGPEVLTTEMLDSDALRVEVAALLKGVARSAGSSGWLKDLYLEGAADNRYAAMINYEAVLIETNQELARRNLPPLYVVYPADGTALADSPLGFLPRSVPDAAEREAFFLKLQAYLLSPPVQERIMATGRRTGLAGSAAGADPEVFRAAWGINPAAPLAFIRFPATETLEAALDLYQEALRKPSLLALCLDYSGSMSGSGEAALEAAIDKLFDPATAKRYLLQPATQDVFVVLPFDGQVRTTYVTKGPEEAARLPDLLRPTSPNDGTDIYTCALTALDILVHRPEWKTHLPGIILMTDGRSQGDSGGFAAAYRERGHDVPIYGITFGDADERQLQSLATLTRARVFDGSKDLTAAFRTARGYN